MSGDESRPTIAVIDGVVGAGDQLHDLYMVLDTQGIGSCLLVIRSGRAGVRVRPCLKGPA